MVGLRVEGGKHCCIAIVKASGRSENKKWLAEIKYSMVDAASRLQTSLRE